MPEGAGKAPRRSPAPVADPRAAIEAVLRRLPVSTEPAPWGMSAKDREVHLMSALALYTNMLDARRRTPETPPRFVHVGRGI